MRRKIHEFEIEMKSVPTLRDLIMLVRGKAVDVEDMNTLLATLPEGQRSKVVLVDWFQPADYPSTERPLFMIVHRFRATPQTFELDAALMGKAEAWINKFPGNTDRKTDDWNLAWEEAQRLRGLIEPLLDTTEVDDALVLCPTGVLHRFPIHALLMSRTSGLSSDQCHDVANTLLERNTVIYTQSMSLFRLCSYARINSSKGASRAAEVFKAAIACPVEEGYDSVEALSDFLCPDDYHTGENVTAERIISICKNADLFHFYGHVHNRDNANPLNAHLLLYTETTFAHKDDTCDGAHDENAMLDARKIMSQMKLREGAHVNLIACDSGVSYPALGDDMMGLIPATLMAGARSACTTLWAVDTNPAGEWTELLVDEWKRARKLQGHSNVINLAQCARQASLSIMQRSEGDGYRESRMRHWAPYVYHGFWEM